MVNQKYLSNNDTLEQRIDKIIEEAAEVIQIALKMKRFGPFSYHPDDPEKKSNIQLLSNEVDDVIHALKRISDLILVDDSSVIMDERYAKAKKDITKKNYKDVLAQLNSAYDTKKAEGIFLGLFGDSHWIDESHEMYDSEINDYDRICKKCGTNSDEYGNIQKLIEPCEGNKNSIKSFGSIV